MILQVIRVVFKLPARGNMGELTTALAAVPSLIDAVGSYKMSADAKKRAEERRRKVCARGGAAMLILPFALL